MVPSPRTYAPMQWQIQGSRTRPRSISGSRNRKWRAIDPWAPISSIVFAAAAGSPPTKIRLSPTWRHSPPGSATTSTTAARSAPISHLRSMGRRHARLPRPLRALCVALIFLLPVCDKPAPYPPDDAKAAGLTAADFPETTADIFRDMDDGIVLSDDEIRGRNEWILWSAGNPVFWDRLAREGFGLLDLLKTLDSRDRPRRFAKMGVINEPGFRSSPAPDSYGLWLD